jgi:glutamate synthase (NADPH/NADH) small chain
MGKITGFLEYPRQDEPAEAPAQRKAHWREFVAHLAPDKARIQAARCMDCGIPFCNSGCPVNNIIPDFNDLVYRDQWRDASEVLHSTNNFPEFTGRICPAPCESACTLNINDSAVGIKSIEHAIVDRAWQEGWIVPQPAPRASGRTVAVVGSGPAGLACAQQLARVGHAVTVFEKNARPGGLLRYGIPDFKLEKSLIDRRIEQMEREGVRFRNGVFVGGEAGPATGSVLCMGAEVMPARRLIDEFDAVVLAGGAEQPRDLPVPGRQLDGVHFALEFLTAQNRVVDGETIPGQILARDRHVIVIGGGDTGSDCVGTSNRHGARSVTQLELLPQPPASENKSLTWPYWPVRLRTSSSHEEGCERDWSITTKSFRDDGRGRVAALVAARVQWQRDPVTGQSRMVEVPGSEFELPADLVLLAMGFVSPLAPVLEAFGVERDTRANVRAATEEGLAQPAYATSRPKVFAAGDMRRGQSLVVWAIREGRQCARAVDQFLTGASVLPR